jgi:hypothetical protein
MDVRFVITDFIVWWSFVFKTFRPYGTILMNVCIVITFGVRVCC